MSSAGATIGRRPAGVITGLQSEARLLAGATVAAAGGRGARAYELAREMAAAGARGLVSFGIAGGLDPALMSGDVVLGNAVMRSDGGAYSCDAGWRARLAARLEGCGVAVVTGNVAGSDRPMLRPLDKEGLALRCRAVAVDMESHGVARAAAEAGLPLLVVRAVADPADRAIPQIAMAGMGANGETRIMPVVSGLLADPAQLPALLAVARDAGRATATLRRIASLGGLDLCL